MYFLSICPPPHGIALLESLDDRFISTGQMYISGIFTRDMIDRLRKEEFGLYISKSVDSFKIYRIPIIKFSFLLQLVFTVSIEFFRATLHCSKDVPYLLIFYADLRHDYTQVS